jgi:branched-chain amino acid transport system substrate-binding protein
MNRLTGFRVTAFTILLLSLLFLSLLFIGCAPEEPPTVTEDPVEDAGDDFVGVIRIGDIHPKSGPLARYGEEEYRGVAIAAHLRNLEGGINGHRIEIVSADAPNPDAATGEAERLIEQGIKVITGSYSSGIGLAASAVAERNSVIYWEMGGIADEITTRGFRYLFRTGPLAYDFGRLSVQVVEDTVLPALGLTPEETRVAIIHEDSVFGSSTSDGVEKYAKLSGMQIILREEYPATVTDLSPVIMKLKDLDPDIVFHTCYLYDNILYWEQAEELDYMPPVHFYGALNANRDVAEAVGRGLEYTMGVDVTQVNTNPEFAPGLELFVSTYEEMYGEPVWSGHSIRSFFGSNVLFDVLEQSPSFEPDDIRETALLVDIPPGQTATGWGVKFAPEGHEHAGTNLRAMPFAAQWRDGETWTFWPDEYAVPGFELVIPLPGWDER